MAIFQDSHSLIEAAFKTFDQTIKSLDKGVAMAQTELELEDKRFAEIEKIHRVKTAFLYDDISRAQSLRNKLVNLIS